MGNFQEAIAKTELFEGGYANTPNDSGGETYRGISRHNWPNWIGWRTIDKAKVMPCFPGCLDKNTILQGQVITFYLKNYWQYDGLTDQDVAWKTFDLGVNVGRVHSVKILQQAVGTNLDGVYGPNTERLANSHLPGSLGPMIRTSAVKYYEAIVQSNPQDAVFLKGWLARAEA